MSLFRAQGFVERETLLTECDLCWVVGNKVVFRQNLGYSVPPESEWGLRAFDPVGESEEVVEDTCDLIDTWCGDARPQVGLGC